MKISYQMYCRHIKLEVNSLICNLYLTLNCSFKSATQESVWTGKIYSMSTIGEFTELAEVIDSDFYTAVKKISTIKLKKFIKAKKGEEIVSTDTLIMFRPDVETDFPYDLWAQFREFALITHGKIESKCTRKSEVSDIYGYYINTTILGADDVLNDLELINPEGLLGLDSESRKEFVQDLITNAFPQNFWEGIK